MRQPALTSTASFQALATHAVDAKAGRCATCSPPTRSASRTMSVEAAGLFLDYSKNRLDGRTLELLLDLARKRGVEEQRAAMFAGEKINVTEQRAVLHTALRAPADEPLLVDGQDVAADVHAVLARDQGVQRRGALAAPGSATAASRSPTSSTSASAAPTSARRWSAWRCASTPIRA